MIFFGVNVGMGALAGAVILVLANATDEAQAIRSMPWGPIMMVSGVTVLITLIEKTGGIDLFSAILASVSTPESVTGVIALIGGTISVYSSTSGVVLPAFLPTVPGLVERLGGGDVLPVTWSLIVGISPCRCFSTVHDGCAVHRGGTEHGCPQAVQADAGVGHVDGCRCGYRVLHRLRADVGVRLVIAGGTSPVAAARGSFRTQTGGSGPRRISVARTGKASVRRARRKSASGFGMA